MRRHPLDVVLVEDDDIDAEAVARCLDNLEVPHVLTVCRSGEEALAKLRDAKRPLGRAYPFVVLLDIHMPQMTGIEVLTAMRSEPMLRSAVVFVLTVSDQATDIAAAYDGAVAGYLVKERLGSHLEGLAALLLGLLPVGRVSLLTA